MELKDLIDGGFDIFKYKLRNIIKEKKEFNLKEIDLLYLLEIKNLLNKININNESYFIDSNTIYNLLNIEYIKYLIYSETIEGLKNKIINFNPDLIKTESNLLQKVILIKNHLEQLNGDIIIDKDILLDIEITHRMLLFSKNPKRSTCVKLYSSMLKQLEYKIGKEYFDIEKCRKEWVKNIINNNLIINDLKDNEIIL